MSKCRFIALLTDNTGFRSGFSYSDTQSSRDQSNLEPYAYWLASPKIRIVVLSFAELEMDKTAHLKLYIPLSGRSKHQLQSNISIY